MTIDLAESKYFEVFRLISDVAEKNHQSCYVVGGFVRSYLMKKETATDIDFVTEQSGIDLALALSKLVSPPRKVSVFKTYGTAMLKYKGLELEFVGARKESYSEKSRKPFVEKASLEDDQKRRDFTVNAMAISLNKTNFGELIDPFQGQRDLENRILRTPLDPHKTYSDDPLRMMRAIRFASVLDFEVEEASLEAISREAQRIKIVSMERIMSEFNKIMLSEKPSKGLGLMERTGLLQMIIPELTLLKGVEEKDGVSHKDNFWHTLQVVDNIARETSNLWLRWAALLHDIGKARTKSFSKENGWSFHGHEFLGSKMVKSLFQRLKLPLGQEMRYVQKLVKLSSRPIALVDDGTSDSALRRLLFDAGDDIEDLFILCRADITTKNRFKQRTYKNNFDYVEEKIKEVEQRDHIRNFQPPVTGTEIMEMFQIGPGREIGILKSRLKEAILEGEVPNEHDKAKAFIISEAAKLGIEPLQRPLKKEG